MPERDELDQMIDSALIGYGEPRLGIEQRVLARVSAEISQESGLRRRLLTAIAAPILASLLLFAYWLTETPRSHPDQMANTLGVRATPPTATPVPHSYPKMLSRDHVRDREPDVVRLRQTVLPRPKLDMFPTLQPLNDTEQAIAQFGREATEADRKALVEARQRVDAPVNITAIQIPPLPSPEQNQN